MHPHSCSPLLDVIVRPPNTSSAACIARIIPSSNACTEVQHPPSYKATRTTPQMPHLLHSCFLLAPTMHVTERTCRLSRDRLCRLWSTAMPIVAASLMGMPASCSGIEVSSGCYVMPYAKQVDTSSPATGTLSSSKLKPRPRRFFRLYLIVCPCTMGRRGPAVGLGKIFFAFSARAAVASTQLLAHQQPSRVVPY